MLKAATMRMKLKMAKVAHFSALLVWVMNLCFSSRVRVVTREASFFSSEVPANAKVVPRVSHLHSLNLNPESMMMGSASSLPRANWTLPSAYATASVGAVPARSIAVARLGPNGLKIGKKTTHFHHSWTRRRWRG